MCGLQFSNCLLYVVFASCSLTIVIECVCVAVIGYSLTVRQRAVIHHTWTGNACVGVFMSAVRRMDVAWSYPAPLIRHTADLATREQLQRCSSHMVPGFYTTTPPHWNISWKSSTTLLCVCTVESRTVVLLHHLNLRTSLQLRRRCPDQAHGHLCRGCWIANRRKHPPPRSLLYWLFTSVSQLYVALDWSCLLCSSCLNRVCRGIVVYCSNWYV